jgi:cytochrome P450
MTTNDPVYWEPFEARFITDPYPVYARLREEAPLYYNAKHDFYAVSRYEDVELGLSDWKTFSSARGSILEIIQSGMEMPPGTVIFEDPPSHRLHRGLLSRLFTPRAIAALEPRVRAFCTRALDPLAGETRFDMMTALGAELPMRVIGALMGIPEEDQEAIRDHNDALLRTRSGERMKYSASSALTNEVFADYINWRREHPSDDLMTALLTAEYEDADGTRKTLTHEEVLTYVTVVTGAGNETTGRLISWITATLANHPDQRREIAADLSLVPGAVEEVLRYETPSPFIGRYVTMDVEYYGQTVPAGSAILFIAASANRDHRRYDNPDSFDIHRTIRHPLSFGQGIHHCLGAALARLEGKVALEEILKRFPDWDVDWEHAKLAQTSTVRGWETLPVVIG